MYKLPCNDDYVCGVVRTFNKRIYGKGLSILGKIQYFKIVVLDD